MSALSLFSKSSMTSSGFLRMLGAAAPSVSFKKQSPSRQKPTPQKYGWQNQGSAARRSAGAW